MTNRPELIADLLMGAAFADSHLDGSELVRVKQLLCELTGQTELPAALEERLKAFVPSTLNVAATIMALDLSSDTEKRKLLELVAAVHDADDLWDFDEDLYLRGVAAALGLAEDSFSDLTVAELQVDIIGDVLLPPPLPKES